MIILIVVLMIIIAVIFTYLVSRASTQSDVFVYYYFIYMFLPLTQFKVQSRLSLQLRESEFLTGSDVIRENFTAV